MYSITIETVLQLSVRITRISYRDHNIFQVIVIDHFSYHRARIRNLYWVGSTRFITIDDTQLAFEYSNHGAQPYSVFITALLNIDTVCDCQISNCAWIDLKQTMLMIWIRYGFTIILNLDLIGQKDILFMRLWTHFSHYGNLIWTWDRN